MSLAPTAHRFTVEDTVLYTWCAWDGLFLPELLGADALIESRCPQTGDEIQVSIGAKGIRRTSPDPVWVSMVTCSIGTRDVVDAFCRHVNFLTEAGRASGDGSMILSIGAAFELGRRVNATVFGEAWRHRDGFELLWTPPGTMV
ncbi:MAG: organomercurial lyase [Actinomycetota bacterium]